MARRQAAGMRVIAGAARGVPLRAPRDRGIRPTASRLRESLFSMLEAAGSDLSRVLDLYAGSGALGIEALSRGGGRCTFVEANAEACRVIRENLRRTRLEPQGEVIRARVGRWQAEAGAGYTLVLADPPYERGVAWGEIEHTVGGALDAQVMLAVEHAARQPPPAALLGCSMWRNRRQGEGAIAVYRPANNRANNLPERPTERPAERKDAV